MVSDQARVQNSAAISFSIHGAAFGAYVLLRLAQPHQAEVVLTQVEFMDLHPAPVQEAAPPAVSPPRGIKDFLKMALPSFKKTVEPQEAPQEMATPKDMQMPKLPDVQRLVDKASPLDRGPSIQLKDEQLPRATAGNLTDMSVPSAPRADDLHPVKDEPSLSLEAVGRRAVRPSGPSIRIDPNASLSRSGRFADMPSGAPSAPNAAPASMQAPAAISLGEGPALRRPGGGLPAGGRIGYGPSGNGISLDERPVARGRLGVPAAPVAKPAQTEATPKEVASRKSKGMEISGPLAGRRILSAVMPSYPEWARSKGVEAEVLIRFFVSPDGAVLDRMILERTSGYDELDRLCMEALKKMVFVPLPNDAPQEDQWGIVTFRFRLK